MNRALKTKLSAHTISVGCGQTPANFFKMVSSEPRTQTAWHFVADLCEAAVNLSDAVQGYTISIFCALLVEMAVVEILLEALEKSAFE